MGGVELALIRDVFQFTKKFWSLKRCFPDHPVHYYFSCCLRIAWFATNQRYPSSVNRDCVTFATML